MSYEVTNMPSKNTVAKVNLMSLCCHGKSKKMHPSLANVQVDETPDTVFCRKEDQEIEL